MKQPLAVEIGTGRDQRGQDLTDEIYAVNAAIEVGW
jgi:hypothetical protein